MEGFRVGKTGLGSVLPEIILNLLDLLTRFRGKNPTQKTDASEKSRGPFRLTEAHQYLVFSNQQGAFDQHAVGGQQVQLFLLAHLGAACLSIPTLGIADRWY